MKAFYTDYQDVFVEREPLAFVASNMGLLMGFLFNKLKRSIGKG